jgi:hypothetical protein
MHLQERMTSSRSRHESRHTMPGTNTQIPNTERTVAGEYLRSGLAQLVGQLVYWELLGHSQGLGNGLGEGGY